MRHTAPRRFLVASLVFGSLLWSSVQLGAFAWNPAVESKLQKLLAHRVEVAREKVAVAKSLWETGRSNLKELSAAASDLANAELELAESKVDRIRILEQLVEIAGKVEGYTKSRHEAGATGGTKLEVLEATSARLQAEIRLERERTAP